MSSLSENSTGFWSNLLPCSWSSSFPWKNIHRFDPKFQNIQQCDNRVHRDGENHLPARAWLYREDFVRGEGGGVEPHQ